MPRFKSEAKRMRTVILAAGDFPSRGSEPERVLMSAARVVACDSAATAYRRRFRAWPDVVIGDFDSLDFSRGGDELQQRCVRVSDQETNDLEKAIRHCRQRGWNDLAVVGATGLREDHTIGNVFRALVAEVPVVTETGVFHPVRGKLQMRVGEGTAVSVFACDPTTRMTSRGLAWKLDGVKFANPYCATLNRATTDTIAVTSTRPAFVYVARPANAVRAVVSLGSNVGNRAEALRRGLATLAALPGTRLVEASVVRETEPVDVPAKFASQKFLNQAAVLETTMDPLAFAREMHKVEAKFGRVRTAVKNGPRTLDIDLILFGDVKMATKELTLPHPRAKDRAFVTEPLAELGVRL
jgi:2-amino-4-hydroxy-6-hydroxymethyldihydropteridine diphosphokinase/thiamine pyrophosphokinase